MSESSKNKYAIFPRAGMQRTWLDRVLAQTTVGELAKVCSCSERTIRDWRREKFPMNHRCLLNICQEYSVDVPKVQTRSRYQHASAAGRKGGRALIERYGRVPVTESKRLQKWRKWWEETGRAKCRITKEREITRPVKSENLAEFVGIMMGDGGISKYQLKITLHTSDDKAYGIFVTSLMKKLFAVPVSIRTRKYVQATDYVVSRRALVQFCTHNLYLRNGNKLSRPFLIPKWVTVNKKYARACVRGLIDTDGSVYLHRYSVRGKQYVYTKLNFTSASEILRKQVADVLSKEGIAVSHYGRTVRIENTKGVKRYFERFGSHNPKHLKRYRESRTM